MKFTKMHGLGNDYIYVNCFEEKIEDPSALSIRLSDRHFGIGSDGLILISPAENADCRMTLYNADGSRAKMCGNGIRCVGKYVYDHGMIDREELTVMTDSGVKTLYLTTENGKVKTVRVDMGRPDFTAQHIPVVSDTDEVIGADWEVAWQHWDVTCVSTGNPHCVVLVSDVDELNLEKIGPLFERDPRFPDRVNTEFVQICAPDRIRMRVWERGSGETMACGTGSCASVAAMIRKGLVSDHATVELRGGSLSVFWDREKDILWMDGPAETVFEGEILDGI